MKRWLKQLFCRHARVCSNGYYYNTCKKCKVDLDNKPWHLETFAMVMIVLALGAIAWIVILGLAFLVFGA